MSPLQGQESWYYARMQAVGRAQSRYLLLLLLISAYTIALCVTDEESAPLNFLGLGPPRAVVNAFAVLTLGVLLLALCGAFEAAREALGNLRARLNDADGLEMYHIDEHPSVADFLSYATRVEGKPGPWAPYGWLIYPVPIVGVFLWAVALLAVEVVTHRFAPGWLAVVHVVDLIVLALAAIRVRLFVGRRWQRFKQARREVKTATRGS